MAGKGGARGQSQVIGAIFVFAFVIAALAAAQLFLVPQANEEVEFKHHQEAQRNMQDLRGAIQRSAVIGATQSASIDLGPEYPTRLLLLNPPEGAGTLRTVDGGRLRIQNTTATRSEVSDFWNGTREVDAPGKRLVYTPSYNLYNAPETVYENSVLYDHFDDGTDIVRTDQDIVDGRRLYLTALDGEKYVSQTESASLDVRPVSAATETITVQRNTSGEPITVTLPTQLSEKVWVQELLAEEVDDDDGRIGPETGDRCADINSSTARDDNDRYVVGCSYDGSAGEISLTLQETKNGNPVTYTLRMAEVGVGRNVSTPSAAYITDIEGDGADVALNGRQPVVFQVRDRFNNPVRDAEVDVRIAPNDPGELLHEGTNVGDSANDSIPVGPDGEVDLTYVAPPNSSMSPIPVSIDAKFNASSYDATSVNGANVSLEVINASRIDRTRPLINSPETLVLKSAKIRDDSSEGELCAGSGNPSCTVDLRFENASDSEIVISDFRYVFYKPDQISNSPLEQFGKVTVIGVNSTGGDKTYNISGDFESINLTIPNDDDGDATDNEGRMRMRFKDESGNPVDVGEGDFFVISFIIDNERVTVFVAPVNDP